MFNRQIACLFQETAVREISTVNYAGFGTGPSVLNHASYSRDASLKRGARYRGRREYNGSTCESVRILTPKLHVAAEEALVLAESSNSSKFLIFAILSAICVIRL